jgi:hypothetical protein
VHHTFDSRVRRRPLVDDIYTTIANYDHLLPGILYCERQRHLHRALVCVQGLTKSREMICGIQHSKDRLPLMEQRRSSLAARLNMNWSNQGRRCANLVLAPKLKGCAMVIQNIRHLLAWLSLAQPPRACAKNLSAQNLRLS